MVGVLPALVLHGISITLIVVFLISDNLLSFVESIISILKDKNLKYRRTIKC